VIKALRFGASNYHVSRASLQTGPAGKLAPCHWRDWSIDSFKGTGPSEGAGFRYLPYRFAYCRRRYSFKDQPYHSGFSIGAHCVDGLFTRKFLSRLVLHHSTQLQSWF